MRGCGGRHHLKTPDRHDAKKQSQAYRKRHAQRIMRVFGKKFVQRAAKSPALAARPSNAQRLRHEPRLQHQPDVHERDVSQIFDRPEMRLAHLLVIVSAFDGYRNNDRAGPRCSHHEFQFKCVSARFGFEPLRQRDWITTKTTLCIAETHTGFHAKPKGRNGVRAPAMSRAASRVKIPHPQGQCIRLLARDGQKFRQVFGKMLTVGIHRDGMCEPHFGGAFEARAQRCSLTLIAFQSHQCATG
jgi:hypothetical protein